MKLSIVALLLTIGSAHLGNSQECHIPNVEDVATLQSKASSCLKHLSHLLPHEMACGARCFLIEGFQMEFDSVLTLSEQLGNIIKGCNVPEGPLKEFVECGLKRAPNHVMDLDECDSFMRLTNCTETFSLS